MPTPAPQPAERPVRRPWVWAAQAALAALVVWFVWQSVSGQLGEFRSLDTPLELRPQWIGLAAASVWLAYLLLILAWRSVLAGWSQRLPMWPAVRIWCVSNLGRYIPGKVWSIAGLAVLARREGVHGWAAAASALAMQALSVGTGAGVVIAFLPQVDSPLLLIGAIAVAVASVGILTLKPVVRMLARVAGGRVELQPLPVSAVLAGAGATLAAWGLYGLAFWFLARGMMPSAALSLPLAVGVFAGGYIVGLFAILFPGGVGVRELMLVGFLAPTLGGGAALALSLGSRLLWTFTEIAAAFVGLVFGRHKGEGA